MPNEIKRRNKGFMSYTSMLNNYRQLSKDEFYDLYWAVADYVETGKIVTFEDRYVNSLYQDWLNSVDNDFKKYNEAADKNREKVERFRSKQKEADTAPQNEPAKETISPNTKVSQIEEKRPLMGIEDTGARTHIETSGEMVGKVPLEEFEETLLKYGSANEAYQDKKVQMWIDDKQYEIATSYIDSFYERT